MTRRMRRRIGLAAIWLLVVLLAPAGLGGPTAVRAVDDGLRMATTSTYTLDPAGGAVHVGVDVQATNLKPDRETATTITRYFFRDLFFAVQSEASRIRATAGGASLDITTRRRKTHIEVTVRLASDLDYRETTRLKLSYDLRGGAPRSESDIRVGVAFATFYAWGHGDDGLADVRVILPASFEDEVEGSTMERTEGPLRILHEARAIADVSDWYVVVVADREASLTSDTVPVGDSEIVVHAWPEDAAWREEVRDVLTRGMPHLQELVGLPWPVTDELDVIEVHTALLEGYAGVFLTRLDRIEISEDLDDLTILHEASHAWFDESLFTERWIYEGLADEYASRALRLLGTSTGPTPGLRPTGEGHVRLNDWVHPGRIDDEATEDRETFGYEASWTIMRRLVNDVGEAAMRHVLAAAEADEIAYRGDGAPESVDPNDDWRRLLDLLQEVGQADQAEALFRDWVVAPGDEEQLDRRAEARERYAELVAEAEGWSVPLYVRDRMERWDFDTAEDRIEEAAAVLDSRAAADALAAELQLDVPAGLEAAWEEAETELDAASTLAAGQLATLGELDEAADDVAAPRDPVVSLGLAGTTPEVQLDAARAAFEAGDLATATASSDLVVAMLAAAPGVGQTRAAALGGGVAGIVVLLAVYGGLRIRRRRAHGRGADALTAEPPTYGTLPGDPPDPSG